MEYFNLLPEEITLGIISRLPTEDVLECKLVCTNWRSLVRDPSFSKMHLDHLHHPAADSGKMCFIALTCVDEKNKYNLEYVKSKNFQYFEYDENQESIERIRRLNFNPPYGLNTCFLGSCNGLICLSQNTPEYLYPLPGKTCICNPITREYVLLPEINKVGEHREISGFGYVASTNEYKVVRMMFENETEFMEVYIYTLGSGNGWRNLGVFSLGTDGCYQEGIFVNGVLCWLHYDFHMMVTFDLAEEMFCGYLSLPFPPDSNSGNYYLGVLDGCLSFAFGRCVNEAECWDVWLLDDNQGVKQQEVHHSLGWVKVFTTVKGYGLFAVTKSYAALAHYGNHINIHHLDASTSKMIVDFRERFSSVIPHKNTFVSLKELGEEDTKIMESVKNEETEESRDQLFKHL
ncbi:putative F-box protein At1g60370 [Papaver somniferum]|uniref:putative F-box protein At1g60370 n=1 Tax=Papaver somniferum TaxID=3469 RepID=UPI000E6FB3B2|nr:putative F-box protein At1g60370 [Papaver somniferum]XP_026389184.1 putative F-box protein At1g60370 [Papaver somniferum]